MTALPSPHFALVRAPEGVLSSFDRRGEAGGPRSELVPLCERKLGLVTPWAYGGMLAIDGRCRSLGWDYRVTETLRPIAAQARARARYLAGQGPKAASPGRSGHGYGGSQDVHTGPLADSGATLLEWHEVLAETTWRPIIPSTSTWATSESWHADCWGPIEGIRRREGYGEATMAGHLLCGQWDHLLDGGWSEDRVAVACLQASLSRAGYRCGKLDGLAGAGTRRAMEAAGIADDVPWALAAESAYTLPTHLGEDMVLRSAA